MSAYYISAYHLSTGFRPRKSVTDGPALCHGRIYDIARRVLLAALTRRSSVLVVQLYVLDEVLVYQVRPPLTPVSS